MTAAENTTATGGLTAGDEITLTLTGIAHGGVCVARHEGMVVFVADGIPGETVRARITEGSKKNFARAVVTEVIDASPDRIEHIWDAASLDRDPELRAGGAEFGHIALPRQRTLKEEVLREAMERFGGIELTAEKANELAGTPGAVSPLVQAVPAAEENGTGYRTRVRLHVDPETGEVGPYAARSHRVIPVETLPLAVPILEQIAPLGERLPDAVAIDLVAPSSDDPRALVTTVKVSQQRTSRTERNSKRAEKYGVPQKNARQKLEFERIGEDERVSEVVAGNLFRVRAGGFWQVHREAANILFNSISSQITALATAGRFNPEAPNLDLYGGVGLLAAALHQGATQAGATAAGGAVRVTSVEQDAAATDDAADNLAELSGALAVSGRTESYLKELLAAPAGVRERLREATIVLDPPRSGAGRTVTNQLREITPANIIYVACDPVALARDTKLLREAGYELYRLNAYDIFPHTHHFETVAVFVRD